MSYLLTLMASAQAQSSQQDYVGLLKYQAAAIDAPNAMTFSLTTQSGVIKVVNVPSITQIQVLAIRSDQPIDLSLKVASGNDVFTLAPMKFWMLVSPEGRAFDHLKLLSSVAASVEVLVAGL